MMDIVNEILKSRQMERDLVVLISSSEIVRKFDCPDDKCSVAFSLDLGAYKEHIVKMSEKLYSIEPMSPGV